MKIFYLFLTLIFCLQLSFGKVEKSSSLELLLNSADSLFQHVPEESLDYATKALKYSEKNNNKEGIIKSSVLLTNLYWQKTDYDLALKYVEYGLEINSDHKYPILQVDLLLAYGRIFSVISDYKKSNSIYFEAYKLAEEINDSEKMSKALSRIGFNYFDLFDFEKALEKYKQAITLSRSNQDSVSISRDLNNIAAAYASMEVFVDFEKNIKEAIEINKRFGKDSWLGVNYMNLGSSYGRAADFEKAFHYLNLAEDIFIKLNQLEKLTKVYIAISDCYYDLGERENEYKYLKQAFDIANNHHLTRLINKTSTYLDAYFIEIGDTLQAYKYAKIRYQTTDSLNIAGNLLNLKNLQFKHSLQKREQEAKLAQQESNFITNMVILGCSTGLIILFLLFLRYRLKLKFEKLKFDKLQGELDFKNRELTTNVLSAMQQKSSISELSEQVKDLKNITDKPEVKLKLKYITSKLGKLENEHIWSDFEKMFNDVHPSFFDNLFAQFPNLTPNEKRLCAFLKLNMSSKNISELTGQKVESLEKARTRLRKKIGLTNTKVNLSSYISQY